MPRVSGNASITTPAARAVLVACPCASLLLCCYTERLSLYGFMSFARNAYTYRTYMFIVPRLYTLMCFTPSRRPQHSGADWTFIHLQRNEPCMPRSYFRLITVNGLLACRHGPPDAHDVQAPRGSTRWTPAGKIDRWIRWFHTLHDSYGCYAIPRRPGPSHPDTKVRYTGDKDSPLKT